MRRQLRSVTSFVALLLVCALAPASHGQLSEVQSGARVRVTAPGILAGRYVGTVLSRTSDTIRLGAPNTPPVDVPVARITALQVSRGSSRALGAGRGALWGGGIGLVAGVIVATVNNNDPVYSVYGGSTDYSSNNVAADVLYGTLSGAFYGVVIGAIVGRERWESFDLASRTSLNVQPGRVGAGLRFTF